MVQKALMEHGREEGLTAEEINEYLIAANYDLPRHHDRLFPYHLNRLTLRNAIIQDPSSVRHTIPGRAELVRLNSQAEVVLCKLKKAKDQYIKNLARPFVKEFHLSNIKRLIKATSTGAKNSAEASTSSCDDEFNKPTLTHDSHPKIASSFFSVNKATRSFLATAGEMSPDPDHGGPGPIVNLAGNVSVRDLDLHPRRGGPGCLSPMGKRPNRPNEESGSEAPGSASGSFKMRRIAHALQSQHGRRDSDNPVDIGGPGVSRPIEPSPTSPVNGLSGNPVRQQFGLRFHEDE